MKYSNITQFIEDIYNSFQENKCMLRAGALTYATTLSVVPFIAIAFSISKGLGFHHKDFIYNFLLKVTANRIDVVENILEYINNTNVAKLGTLGVAGLLIVVLTLLGTIEDTLNSIFEAPRNRTIKEKITYYFSGTLLTPILLIVLVNFASSITSIGIVKKILSFSVISHIYLLLLKVIPFVVIWFSIFLIFYYLPNTKVNLKGVLIGSFFSAMAWGLSRSVFISYHPYDAKYNAIYGGFAKVLLVLLWIYFTWLMLLVGAVIAHEFSKLKYIGKFRQKEKLGMFNIKLKELIFLNIILYLIDSFKKGDGEVEISELVEFIKIPEYILEDFLNALMDLGFILKSQEKTSVIVSSDIFSCPVSYFLDAIRSFCDVKLKLDMNDYKSILNFIKQNDITLEKLNHKLNIEGYFKNRKVNAQITSE